MSHDPRRCYDPAHRSYSSDRTFDGCQFRWHAEHDLGLGWKGNERSIVGSVVDLGVMSALSSEPPVDVAHALEVELTDAGMPTYGKSVDAMFEKANRLLDLWHRECEPTYPPVHSTQLELHADIAGVTYHFHPDIVFEDGGVIDLKTSEKRLGEMRARDDVQLTTYAYALWREYGVIPPYVGLDGLIYANPPREIIAEAEIAGLPVPAKPWLDRQRSTRTLEQLHAFEDECRRREAARRFARTTGIYQTNGRVRRGECTDCPAIGLCPSWVGFEHSEEVDLAA